MKFALIALLAISFAGCSTGNLYTHHEDFSPKKGKGPWTDKYNESRDDRDPGDPNKRPLFPKTEPVR